MDESLPYMDGVEAAIHLRRISELNLNSPVVIMSDDNSENAKLARKQAGVTAELIKPVKSADILKMVTTLIDHAAEVKVEGTLVY